VAVPFEAEFDAAGYRFRVCSSPALLGQHVAGYLKPFRVASRSAGHVATYRIAFEPDHSSPVTNRPAPYVVTLDGAFERSADSAGRVVEHLLWTISRHATAQVAAQVAIHAAAASLDGVGVVMPAPMNAGKTTLVAGLVHGGLSYLTDEMTLIDPASGCIVPFPRALWVDRRSVALIPGLAERVENELMAPDAESVHIRPNDLRLGAIGESCRPGFVVAPSYEPGAPTTAEPVPRAQALQLLVVHSQNIQRFGRRGLEVLAGVVAGADCYRLRVGDLASAVRVVTELVEAGPGPPSSWSPVGGERRKARTDDTAGPIEGSARPRARSDVAGVEIDGDTVLYDVPSGGVHLLNRIAGILWANFDGRRSLDELGGELVVATGQDAELVRTSVLDLARRLGAEGLLEGVQPRGGREEPVGR